MIEVELPDKDVVLEFPDGMDQTEMMSHIYSNFYPEKLGYEATPPMKGYIPDVDVGLTAPAEMPEDRYKVPQEAQPSTQDTLAPDFMGEAVGEPRVLGQAIDVPFIPGREIARAPGPFTGEDPFAIDEKGASISDIGGKMGRAMLSQGAATEAMPYDAATIENIGNMGEQIGRLVAETGVEIGVANILIKTLVGTIGSTAKLIRESNWWRQATIPERQMVVQSLDDVIRANPDMSEGEILRKYDVFKEDAVKARGAKLTSDKPVVESKPEPIPKVAKPEKAEPAKPQKVVAPEKPKPEPPKPEVKGKEPWEMTEGRPPIEGKAGKVISETFYRAGEGHKAIDDFKGIGTFAGTKQVAKNVAGGKSEIVSVDVKLNNPFEMTNSQFRKHVGFGKPLRDKLMADGYDGIVIRYKDGNIGEVVSFKKPTPAPEKPKAIEPPVEKPKVKEPAREEGLAGTYTFETGTSFAISKKKALSAIDDVIKIAKKQDKPEGFVRFIDPESNATFDVTNDPDVLAQFRKKYNSFVTQTGLSGKPPTRKGASTRPSKPKENWDLGTMRDFKNGWISDGSIIIKSELPKGKITLDNDPPPFSKAKELMDGELIPAEIRYYTTTDPNMGEALGKVPIVKLGESTSYAIIKAGKKRYPFDVEKLNIITNRYPDATLKFNPENMMLVAQENGKSVAGLMPMRFEGQKDIPNIKWASKKGYASAGEYATNITSVIDLPEIVGLAKGLLKGKYPSIKKRLSAAGGKASGVFFPKGEGRIDLRADIFQDIKQASAVLAHEIGHLIDYLPEKLMTRGNILGRMASLKKYMKHSLARMPGGLGELTSKDRARLKYQAKKMVMKDGAERWIDEVIRVELPITPQDVLAIWNAVVDARMITPDLYEYIARLDTVQKKAVVMDAMKGVVRADLKKFATVIEEKTGKQIKIELSEEELRGLINQQYADLINAELEKRRLFDLFTITKELKSLTHAWKPFDPLADPKFTKYRYSSVELYADAFSALVNAPGLLKSHAPNFYEGFFNYLENKPEVKKLYNKIQDEILNGTIDQTLDNRILDGFRRGDDAYAKALDRDYRIKDGLMREFIDQHWALIKKVRKIGPSNIPAGENPRYKMEELVYSGAETEWIMGDVFNKIIKPIEKASLNWDDFGYELLLRRVAKGDRQELANTEGIHPSRAEKKLKARNDLRTPAQIKAMDDAIKAFKELNKYITDRGISVGRWSDDLVELMQKNSDYATYDVVDYIEKRNGAWISSKIFPQIGTLKEIANPATATIMKHIAIVKAINRQVAVESVANFLRKNFPNEINVADTRWNGKFHELKKPPPDKGLIVYLKKGKAQGYYVDKWISDMFESNPIEGMAIAKILKYTIQPFRMAFVELNYGFWMFNIIRDYFRASTNLPKASLLKFLPSYIRGLKPAFKSVFGIPDDVVKQMLQDKQLISIADVRGLRPEDKQIERMQKMYHMSPQTWNNKIIAPFGKMFTFFTNIGRGFERTPKVAGKFYLEKKFPQLSKEEMSRIIRNQAGSPNFLSLGRAYPIYNNIFMFSNAIKEGYRGDYKAFTRNPGSFMWKKAKYVYIPKLLMYGATLGLLGVGTKLIMDGASEYDKTNYTVIPLGLTESGKSVYLRVPMDETGRLMGGILWKILNRDFDKLWTGLFDYMSGQAPTLNPAIDILMDVADYAAGKNPYDSFRGRYAIPEQVFEAGGKRKHEYFLKWLANKSGTTIVYRFRSDDIKDVRSELEKLVQYPFMSNIVGRFLKVSDYGIRENLKEIKQDIRKTRAGELLDTKESVFKIINGEQITEKEKELILKNPDVVGRAMAVGLSRKYGNVFLQELLTAQSTQEKMAVWKAFFERQKLLKEASK